MLPILLLLLDLLTDDDQVALLAQHLFLFGMVNTAIFCFVGCLSVFRHSKFRRNTGEPSLA